MRSMICALAMLAASSAGAATVTVTHTGHVTAGTDDFGLFGAAGADLAGTPYTIVFTMDLSQTDHGVFTYPTGEVSGYSFGPESVSVTFGNVTRHYSDPVDGNMNRETFPPGIYVTQYFAADYFDDASNPGGNTYIVAQLGSNTPMFQSVDLTTPFSYTAQPGDYVGGQFYYRGDYISLEDESVRSTGAVPEPASWAMMLGGFGLVGGAMRSRRKAAVSFA
jgi:hypothetical protein